MNKATALLIIDVQKGFDFATFGQRNNLHAEHNIEQLLKLWRRYQWPVIHIKHNSLDINSPLFENQVGNEIKAQAMPINDEILFTKQVNSSFIGTHLEDHLHKNHITELIIVGLTTDHCVSTTTRMAANLGFKVTLISDATATFERQGIDGKIISADDIHNINLASLNDEFCKVVSTQDIQQWVDKSLN